MVVGMALPPSWSPADNSRAEGQETRVTGGRPGGLLPRCRFAENACWQRRCPSYWAPSRALRKSPVAWRNGIFSGRLRRGRERSMRCRRAESSRWWVDGIGVSPHRRTTDGSDEVVEPRQKTFSASVGVRILRVPNRRSGRNCKVRRELPRDDVQRRVRPVNNARW